MVVFKRRNIEFTVRMKEVFMYNSDQPQASNSVLLTVEARVQLRVSQWECFTFTNRCTYLLVSGSTKIYIKIY